MKKLLAIILALTMLVSIMPAAFAASEDASAESYVYAFGDDISNLENSSSIKSVTINNTQNTWSYLCSYNSDSVNVRKHSSNCIEATVMNPGPWFALKINVPTSGKYAVKLDYVESKTAGGYGEVYLMPDGVDTESEIEAALSAITSLGEVKYYDETPDDGSYAQLSNVVIEAGEERDRVIVFKASKKGDGGDTACYMNAKKLTLTPDDGYTFKYNLNPQENETDSASHLGDFYTDYEDTHNMWKWHGGSTKSGLIYARYYNMTSVWNGEEIVAGEAYGVRMFTRDEKDWAAIKIKAPSAGTYNASLTYMVNSAAGAGNVYLLPVSTTPDIQAALDANPTPLNSSPIVYNNRPEAGYTKNHGNLNADLGEFTVAENEEEYYLVFKAVTKYDGNQYCHMYP